MERRLTHFHLSRQVREDSDTPELASSSASPAHRLLKSPSEDPLSPAPPTLTNPFAPPSPPPPPTPAHTGGHTGGVEDGGDIDGRVIDDDGEPHLLHSC